MDQANFLKRFGVESPQGLVIPAEWQSGLGNGSSAGGIIGLLVRPPPHTPIPEDSTVILMMPLPCELD
jgi:hypothetical protein